VGFLGANGAGKTTTMRILTGFLTPTSGRATIGGLDVHTQSLEARRLLGYLPENTPLYKDMRVSEFLHYRARLKGVAYRERYLAVGEALARCGVADVAERIIGQLSKGYRQRVGLADCLLGRPRLLVLDEPTVGLDPNQVVETRNLIRTLGEQRTVFLSTHILHEVELLCQRVLIVDRGRLVAEGATRDLCETYAQWRDLALEIVAPEAPSAALLGLKGVRELRHERQTPEGAWNLAIRCAKDSDPRQEIARLVAQKGWVLQEMRLEPVRLEDIFARLTKGEAVPA
jgi:ABC-2 type transport system ATP-binding protein